MPLTAIAPTAVGFAGFLAGTFGGEPRRGGADPCCAGKGSAPSPWPINSGVGGAPPDFRNVSGESPSGVGRLKDDACDCIPILHRGRFWVIDARSERWVETNREGRLPTGETIQQAQAAEPTILQRGQAVVRDIFEEPLEDIQRRAEGAARGAFVGARAGVTASQPLLERPIVLIALVVLGFLLLARFR